MFADSVNLMAQTHAHQRLTRHPQQRREVYTRPFCRRAGGDGEPPLVLSFGRDPGGPFFFFSSPFHFLKRHFIASIALYYCPPPLFPHLKWFTVLHKQILITVSMGSQTPNKDTDFAQEALSFHHPEEIKREGD